MMQVLMTVSANLPEEILIGNHPRMRVVKTVEALDESQVTSRWASRLVGEVQVADPEIPEEVEMVMRVNKAEMRTSAAAVVVGAEEEQEARETQAVREIQGDLAALEAPTGAEEETHKAQFNIRWLFAWKE